MLYCLVTFIFSNSLKNDKSLIFHQLAFEGTNEKSIRLTTIIWPIIREGLMLAFPMNLQFTSVLKPSI